MPTESLKDIVKDICEPLPYKPDGGQGYSTCKVCNRFTHFGHHANCPVPRLKEALEKRAGGRHGQKTPS